MARSNHVGYLLAIVVGLAIGGWWGTPLVRSKNGLGFAWIAIGPLLTVFLYGGWRGYQRASWGVKPGLQRRRAALLALIAGPLLGTLAWVLWWLTSPVTTPAEGVQMLTALMALGALAGAIVATALGVASWFK